MLQASVNACPQMISSRNRSVVVLVLGASQTLSWASTYYLPAMLAESMARDLSVPVSTIFAAFSVALVVAAFLGPRAGRFIDRHGGRPVLIGTSLIFVTGLSLLAIAESTAMLFGSWIVIGIGMGAGLYEAAFATIVRLYGDDSRSPITGITLIGGFASTVSWPLSAWLEVHYGWRGACLTWAALHLFLGVGLNALVPRAPATAPERPTAASNDPITTATKQHVPVLASLLLAYVFAVTWFISTAMAAHFPRLLEAAGVTFALAVAYSTLIGPSQVAARLFEFALMRRMHALRSAQIAGALHPLGATLLLILGAPAAVAFTVMHGAGIGILTIAIGTLPLVIFGAQGYGARQGLLMIPARLLHAFAPFLFGLCVDRWGSAALWISAALGFSALCSLLLLSAFMQRPAAQGP